MRKYGIQAITEDALLKNYYRWRDKVRKKSKRRGYAKQQNDVKYSWLFHRPSVSICPIFGVKTSENGEVFE